MLSPTGYDLDSNNRELVPHGTTAFPIACYDDDLNDYCFPWHWHEELEAGIITKGEPLINIGTQSFHIKPGDGFFVNTGVLHSGQVVRPQDMRKGPSGAGKTVSSPAHAEDLQEKTALQTDPSAKEEGQCRLHSVVFHERLIGGSRESVYYQRYVLPLTAYQAFEGCMLQACTPWQAEALGRIETAYQACMNEPEDYELTIRSALSELFAILLRNIPAQQAPPDAKTLREAERIKRMLQFIEMHYAENLSTADIAKSVCVSESECLRCFHTTIGTTPIRYLREYRIERAAQMLSGGQVRPAEAAAACGFQDMSYFDRTFRQLRSCTPSEYARRVRG